MWLPAHCRTPALWQRHRSDGRREGGALHAGAHLLRGLAGARGGARPEGRALSLAVVAAGEVVVGAQRERRGRGQQERERERERAGLAARRRHCGGRRRRGGAADGCRHRHRGVRARGVARAQRAAAWGLEGEPGCKPQQRESYVARAGDRGAGAETHGCSGSPSVLCLFVCGSQRRGLAICGERGGIRSTSLTLRGMTGDLATHP